MANEMSRRDVMKTGLAAAALGAAAKFRVGAACAGAGRGDGAVHGFTREPAVQSDPGARSPAVRHAHAVERVHAEGSVLHDAALRPSRRSIRLRIRLKVGGLVNTPLTLSLDELRKMGNAELIAGFECSGNRRPVQGLIGNGRWTGVPLKTVLDKAGLKSNAREIVFFGADRGKEAVNFRGTNFDVEQQYGRSIHRDRRCRQRSARRSSPMR